MSDPYQDIRPYRDAEVREVIARIGRSPDLLQALIRYRLPWLPRPLTQPLSRGFSWYLRYRLRHIETVDGFQAWLREWVQALVEFTTRQVTVRGLDALGAPFPCLLLSNHRDIAMDPTMVNFALMTHAWPTAEIAIGDNLLQNPVLSDVMRLNKAFVVKRSPTMGKREKLTEMQKLSAYIRDTLQSGHLVWLAQREGRAKDNRDHTDTGVLKMLALSGRSDALDFPAAMARLYPVPVAVHYEWDPCDVLKARELVALAETGTYIKAQEEDTQSLLLGLRGFKGQVSICFGRPLVQDELTTASVMAAAVDTQIRAMTPVYSNSHAALLLLQERFDLCREVTPDHSQIDVRDTDELLRRCEGESSAVVIRLLTNYAAPLLPLTER